MDSIFRIGWFGGKEGLNESSRTPSWWSVAVFLLHIPSSVDRQRVNSTLPSHLILSFLSAAQYRSDCHNFPCVKGMHTHML